MEIVQEMSKYIKAQNYRVEEDMINCFLSLKLRESLVNRTATETAEGHKKKGKQPHLSRNKRKEGKAEKELSRELKELEAEVNKKELSHKQTAILQNLFATYFRLLKNATQSPLLPAALEV